MKLKCMGLSLKALFVMFMINSSQVCVYGQSGEVLAESIPSNSNPARETQIDVQINIDMSQVNSPDNELGSYTGKLTWDQAVLEYVSHSGGNTPGWASPTVNNANVSTGEVRFTGVNASGSAAAVNVFNLKFKVIGAIGSTTSLTLEFSAMAAAKTFKNLLGILTITSGRITVAENCFDVSGKVSYFKSANPVPETIIQLTGTLATQEKTSNTDGNYLFEKIASDNVQLLSSRPDGPANAISGSDALLVLQYLAFLVAFTPDEHFAADVTEDGSVMGSDAQAILRYLAYYSDNIASCGQWRFNPADSSFTLTENAQVNFKAFLLGDATGDWTSTELAQLQDLFKPLSRSFLRISIDDKNVKNRIVVSVILTVIHEPVNTLVFTLNYDSVGLKYIDTGVTAYSQNFMMVANGTEPGKVHVAMAGVNAIQTSNAILRLVFEKTGHLPADGQMDFRISRALINDRKCMTEDYQILSKLSNETNNPSHFLLEQNYPNPFSWKGQFANTMISFQLPLAAETMLTIYNIEGKLIKRTNFGLMPVGRHQFVWNGINDTGDKVAAGLYFYQLTSGPFKAIKKLLIVQ